MTSRRWISLALAAVLFLVVPPVVEALTRAVPEVPDHTRWTVRACEKYWAARDRGLWVVSPSNPTPHAPTPAERDPSAYVVKMNYVSSPKQKPAPIPNVTVVLEAVGTLKPVEKLVVTGGSTNLKKFHDHYEKVGVVAYYSHEYQTEELNPYDSDLWDRECEEYQSPWIDEPVYEGGSVGVVINGSVSEALRAYLVHIVAAMFAAAAVWVGWRRSSGPREKQ